MKDFYFPRGQEGEPLLEAIQRLEAEGFEVRGLRDQYTKMKSALRSQSEAFREILDLAVAKSATFQVVFGEEAVRETEN